MVSNFQSTFQNKDATQRKQSHRFPDPVCEHPVGGACGRHRHQLPFHPLFDPSLCSFVRRTSLSCGRPPPSLSLSDGVCRPNHCIAGRESKHSSTCPRQTGLSGPRPRLSGRCSAVVPRMTKRRQTPVAAPAASDLQTRPADAGHRFMEK